MRYYIVANSTQSDVLSKKNNYRWHFKMFVYPKKKENKKCLSYRNIDLYSALCISKVIFLFFINIGTVWGWSIYFYLFIFKYSRAILLNVWDNFAALFFKILNAFFPLYRNGFFILTHLTSGCKPKIYRKKFSGFNF